MHRSRAYRRAVGFFVVLMMFTIAGGAEESGYRISSSVERGGRGPEFGPGAEKSTPRSRSGRLIPTIRLGESRRVDVDFSGSGIAVEALRERKARPLSLASDDFDEDGVPDLVCGFGFSGGGIITLHRGNVDALYPHAPEARARRSKGTSVASPFLPDARIVEMPEPPDFLATGDFDADGHRDIVAGRRGSDSLRWIPGDGVGGFGEARTVRIDGQLTALTAGDLNRPDGLADVMVGLTGPNGNRVLIFEDPRGALRGEPEPIVLPGKPVGLALGEFDDDAPLDLVIAAGSDIVVMRGRDRRLSLDEDRRSEVLPARITRASVPFAIGSLAVGDFGGDGRPHLALTSERGDLHLLPIEMVLEAVESGSELSAHLSPERASRRGIDGTPLLLAARISNIPGDDLVVVDDGDTHLHIRAAAAKAMRAERAAEVWTTVKSGRSETPARSSRSAPTAVLPMRLGPSAQTSLVMLSDGESTLSVIQPEMVILTVTNTNDSGPASLRQAILDANATPGVDTIHFNIAGAGVHTIRPLTLLPVVTEGVIIDGTSQPGFAGTPLIELSGELIPAGAATDGPGLVIDGGPSTVRGLVINRFIGGENAAIVLLTNGNLIDGNFLGTNAAGTSALGNGLGLHVLSSLNVIGGTLAAARNLISGNSKGGIFLEGFTGRDVAFNSVRGNYIGTDVSGTVAIPNHFTRGDQPAIWLLGTFPAMNMVSNNTIGGTGAGSGNLIAGDLLGVRIEYAGGGSNLVQGNFIGTTVSGTAAMAATQWVGVIAGGPGVTVGGTTPAARNIISGYTFVAPGILTADGGGIQIWANGTQVQNNFIGTDVNGVAAIPNTVAGIQINTGANVIGGSLAAARNIISGNLADGILLRTRFGLVQGGNTIAGNFIGTDVTGTADLGNALNGVRIIDDGASNEVGFSAPERNVISGNDQNGVLISGAGTSSNFVQGNYIGTDVTGTLDLGNGFSGVELEGTANNEIGGADPINGNVISGNDSSGVQVISFSAGNVVAANLIGTQADGVSPLGNSSDGVFLSTGLATLTFVGASLPENGNTIAFNGNKGVNAVAGSEFIILSNRIHSNSDLGIDLGNDGVTPNDPGDIDTGANNLQNFPVVTSASSSAGSGTTIQGTLDSLASEDFALNLFANNSCDPSGHGEGEILLGSLSLTTDAVGGGIFNVTFPEPIVSGQVVTALALRSLNGDTSEFSSCFAGFVGRPGTGMGAALDLAWSGTDGSTLEWGDVAGASSYALFRGTGADISFLSNTGVDSCLRAEVTDTTTGQLLVEEPPLGSFDWYIMRPSNGAGDAFPADASAGARIHDSSPACSSACTHDTCTNGVPLTSGCDPCVEQVCRFDPFCCNNAWDGFCVAQVRTVCKSLKCSEATGSCAHDLCASGSSLVAKCDNAAPSQSCVEQICSVDSFCCDAISGSWDSICIHRVDSECGKRCY